MAAELDCACTFYEILFALPTLFWSSLVTIVRMHYRDGINKPKCFFVEMSNKILKSLELNLKFSSQKIEGQTTMRSEVIPSYASMKTFDLTGHAPGIFGKAEIKCNEVTNCSCKDWQKTLNSTKHSRANIDGASAWHVNDKWVENSVKREIMKECAFRSTVKFWKPPAEHTAPSS